MSIETWSAVDRYFTDLLVPSDPELEAALEASNAAGLPPISVSSSQGMLLHVLARAAGARNMLEIGTLGGYSTIWLARALPAGGRLISLEAEAKHAEVARTNIARAGLEGAVEIRLGPATESMAQLVEEGSGPFDVFFIDADKEGYAGYLAWSLKLSRVGSLIIADNVVRGGAVADPTTTNPRVQGVQRFSELLASTPNVSAVGVQTVGEKGYDGFALAVVT